MSSIMTNERETDKPSRSENPFLGLGGGVSLDDYLNSEEDRLFNDGNLTPETSCLADY